LGQATRGSAAVVVMKHERNGSPDGRAAWLELERVYGGRAEVQRSMQLISLEMKLREMYCSSAEDAGDFVIQLDHVWAEFKQLEAPKENHAKVGALVIGIKDSMPQVFAQLSTQPDLSYDEL
ncbi:unnamed protein product, partial [Discosporangium mesarthrocarpum]